MIKIIRVSALVLAALLPLTSFCETGSTLASRHAYTPVPDFGRIPLYFIPNRGQRDSRTLFYAATSRYTLWLTEQGMAFGSSRLEFPGASSKLKVVAADPSDYRVSYFEGSDPERWQAGLPTSAAVLYQGLYDRINLKIYGVEREVEYDWIVEPGGDPGRIRMAYRDVRKTGIDREGNLVVETALGEIAHRKPEAYQVIDGRRIAVEAAFKTIGKDEYGFRVGTYDPARDLIIDPYVVVYSTYLGGSLFDRCSGFAIDTAGALYIAGYSESADFPASTSANGAAARNDDFVTKLSPDGQSLIYTVFLAVGQPQEFFVYPGLAVDAAGAAYLAGTTQTHTFPVKNAFQPKFGGGYLDAFITKIAPDGRSLVYSSFLGGGEIDACGSVAVDGKGTAYIAGYTWSSDFRVKNAYQANTAGALEAFVTKVAPNGKSLAYSTYLGGSGHDEGWGIAVDSSGAAYVVGTTESANFPTKHAYQKTLKGMGNLFVTKFAPDGRSLSYSTFWGSQKYDYAAAIAVDGGGYVYVLGYTYGNITMKNALQPVRKGSDDVILAKFAPNGQSLVFSTYLGGSASDWSNSLAVDKDGAVYVTGGTGSYNFPKKNPCQTALKGKYDAFVTKFDPSGRSLAFSTFLGGAYQDFGIRTVAGPGGEIYVAGYTNSLDIPVVKPYQKKYGGGEDDLFITKYSSGAQTAGRKRR